MMMMNGKSQSSRKEPVCNTLPYLHFVCEHVAGSLRADLRGADLTDADTRNADLRGVDLSATDLGNSN